jgi:hypothetical protein
MAVSERVRQRFLAEVAGRNLTAELLPDGRYRIAHEGRINEVSLENKSREVEATGNEDIIAEFVETLLQPVLPIPKTWAEARIGIFFTAESAEHDFGDTLRQQISDQVCRVLVYHTPDGRNIAWISPHMLDLWQVSQAEVQEQASANLADLLKKMPVHVEPIDEYQLCMFGKDSPFKAALIFAPNLREVLEELIGWPVFAVIPCRDFIYFVGEKDRDLLPRLGPVVVREYNERGYSISTEVFRIDDQGVSAIAEFQRRRSEAPIPEGMQRIRHEGMTFHLPEHWEEDEEEDGPIYYDPDSDHEALRLRVVIYRSDEEVTGETVQGLLADLAEQHGEQVLQRPDGSFLLAYAEDAEQDGRPTRMWYWVLARPLPPQHAQMIVFSYCTGRDFTDNEEVAERVMMLFREIPKAEFAS